MCIRDRCGDRSAHSKHVEVPHWSGRAGGRILHCCPSAGPAACAPPCAPCVVSTSSCRSCRHNRTETVLRLPMQPTPSRTAPRGQTAATPVSTPVRCQRTRGPPAVLRLTGQLCGRPHPRSELECWFYSCKQPQMSQGAAHQAPQRGIHKHHLLPSVRTERFTKLAHALHSAVVQRAEKEPHLNSVSAISPAPNCAA